MRAGRERSKHGFYVCSLGIQVKVAPSAEVKKPGSWVSLNRLRGHSVFGTGAKETG